MSCQEPTKRHLLDCRNPSNILEEIACKMTNNKSSSHSGLANADAGMTYIGQMISHDIVPPTKKNAHSRIVTPYLNLDSIYGESAPECFKFAPEKTIFLDKTGRFKMSKYKGVQDLKRRSTSKGWEAVIPEPRNDENRIISQLHLFWQKIHNWMLDKGFAEDALEAKKYTTLIFQLVAIEGFCKSTFNEAVFRSFFLTGTASLNLRDHYTEIPAFFSKASFRFGHSMVRSMYTLNKLYPETSLDISTLLGKRVRLEKKLEIDWALFFAVNDATNGALKIDTFAIDSLRNVPNNRLQPKIGIADVILFNLKAGNFVSPAMGDAFVNELLLNNKIKRILKDCGFERLRSLHNATFNKVAGLTHKTLPLWPYILLEAEKKEVSFRLGPLGSLLNARVLYSAIKHSKFSVIDHKGYCFESALSFLDRKLSCKLIKSMDFISATNASNDPDVHPIMEALIFLVN